MKITAATCIARTVIYHARRIRFLYPGGKTPHSYAINDATREIRKYKTASDTLDHLTPAAGTCPDFISELAILIAKAPSILATMSKQHCRTLQVQRFFRTCSICFDFVERTKFRSTLLPKQATLLPKTATMSKQHATLSKGRNFTIESFDIVAVCGNKLECCFDKVERCFDNVAGVDGALSDNAIITNELTDVAVISSNKKFDDF